MEKLFLTLATMVVFSAGAVAGNLTLKAGVDRTLVPLDGQLLLEIQVSGDAANIPAPRLPDLPGFAAYSAGSSQNISFINGAFASSLSFRYSLVPRQAGKFTIPPVTLEHDGTTYRTDPIDVEVLPAGSAPAAPPAARQQAVPAPDREREHRDLFVTAELDKASVHVNEQATYIFRFYRRIRLLSNPNYSSPDFAGFWSEGMPPKNYSTTVDGIQYQVTEVRTALFPTRPGRFTIGSASLRCAVEDFSPGDFFADDFFKQFFAGSKTRLLHTGPVSLSVLPLPTEGRPASFGGAVGHFTAAASLDKRTVKANEPVTLTLKIEGTGNVKALPDPALGDWPGFRKYETASSFSLNNEGEAVRGSKVFTTIIVPQVPGRATIPSIPFSFFDPRQKSYVTAATTPLALEVLPGDPAPGQAAAPAGPGGITDGQRDINYLKTLDRWRSRSIPLYRRTPYLVLNAAPLALLGVALLLRRRQERLRTDIAFARRRRASGMARKYLRHAARLRSAENAPEFYAAVARSLRQYIADRANVSAEGLTFAAIEEMMTARRVPAATVQSLRTVLDECDLVRFAPARVSREMMAATYRTGEELIDRLEKEFT